jgi:hypothetical protein
MESHVSACPPPLPPQGPRPRQRAWQLTKEQLAGDSWRSLFLTLIGPCQGKQQHKGERNQGVILSAHRHCLAGLPYCIELQSFVFQYSSTWSHLQRTQADPTGAGAPQIGKL